MVLEVTSLSIQVDLRDAGSIAGLGGFPGGHGNLFFKNLNVFILIGG